MSNNYNNDQPLPFGAAMARDGAEPMNVDSDNHGNNQGNNNSAPAPEGSRQSGSGETSVSQTTAGSSAPEKVHTCSIHSYKIR
ncbi:hypothetical protein O0I10_012786 [Lichtheimia ornata]|uniref:Uncharacterized protein n=1 Tax=Lichtheimia ornata TaxID=688661 RepID=A0AAD7UR38_9FUNG|nr:uncharacterized protein O0I10_012786 [Lichtheimia ornata]KAJ8651640.1 hypothetical protein O0I10_012786 [Lichtheimia ornata]